MSARTSPRLLADAVVVGDLAATLWFPWPLPIVAVTHQNLRAAEGAGPTR
jgi:hypothetical protein